MAIDQAVAAAYGWAPSTGSRQALPLDYGYPRDAPGPALHHQRAGAPRGPGPAAGAESRALRGGGGRWVAWEEGAQVARGGWQVGGGAVGVVWGIRLGYAIFLTLVALAYMV